MDGQEGKCILVVDDDRHLQVTLSDYLEFVGFEAMVADSAEEALKMIKKRAPDLVILDISMPGMGGMGFLKHTRTPDGKCKYPVLVLTARSAMEEFFGNVEVEGFLAKPCPEYVLEKKIRQILARKTVEAARAGGGSRRVLVGENDRNCAEKIGKAMQKANWKAEFADSGPELLRKAAASPPDAILIKELFPRMAGHAIAPLIKAMPSTTRLPVVIYDSTGAAPKGDSDGKGLPGVTRLVTSDDPDLLIRAIRDSLA